METTSSRSAIVSSVRAELARRDIRHGAAAEAIGLNQHAFSRRMRGEVEFSASEVQRLAELLGTPVATLYGEVSA